MMGQRVNVANPLFIDTHVHLLGGMPGGTSDYEGAAKVALQEMSASNVVRSLVMPPPFPAGHATLYDYDAFVGAVRAHRDHLAFLGGGGSLNPMIQEAVRAGQVSDNFKRKFEERARRILADGAVGFGEMTAEHFSIRTQFHPGHPYVSAPADHPLFLLLADIAAAAAVPIDLHMEAAPRDIPLPPRYASPPNPPEIRANIPGLERLLAHNRKAHIVWVHAGNDLTGHWTVELSRRLLEAHPNLYLSIKIAPPTMPYAGVPQSSPIAMGTLRPEWLELIRSFPDRLVIGSDAFYPSPRSSVPYASILGGLRIFLSQLPADLAQKVGIDNAVRLYNLPAPAR